MNRSNVVLLVEDNADDAALTLRMFRNSNVLNDIVVVRDGVEALDYLYGAGADHAPASVACRSSFSSI